MDLPAAHCFPPLSRDAGSELGLEGLGEGRPLQPRRRLGRVGASPAPEDRVEQLGTGRGVEDPQTQIGGIGDRGVHALVDDSDQRLISQGWFQAVQQGGRILEPLVGPSSVDLADRHGLFAALRQ